MNQEGSAPRRARPRVGLRGAVRGLGWVLTSALLTGGGVGANADRLALPGVRAASPLVAERALRVHERVRRASLDFAARPSGPELLGPDPYALALLDGGLVAVALRAESAVALLDARGVELDRVSAPDEPRALAATGPSSILVGGRGAPGAAAVWAYAVEGARLVRRPDRDVDTSLADVSAVDVDGGALVLLDHDGSSLELHDDGPDAELAEVERPFRAAVSRTLVAAVSALDHALVVHDRTADGLGAPTRLALEAPLYAVDVAEGDEDRFVVAVGLEDHPLDRTGGSFAYIDSRAYVLRAGERGLERCAEVDLSGLGVVLPKVVHATLDGDALEVEVWGAASGERARLRWPQARCPLGAPEARVAPGALGVSAAIDDGEGGRLAASPLLDAVVRLGADGGVEVWPIVPRSGAARARSAESRLGELLVFSTAMAPWQRSEGELSRFSCEACHLEGGTDGRVHATGRGDVRANTKPLLGIGNNLPHFSRALDRDTTSMVFAEFRVAAARSGASPWFDLADAPVDYLADLGWAHAVSTSPWGLRRALIEFFFDFGHAPNRAALGRERFDALEARGAELFEQRCVSCHAARTVTDDPSTTIPRERWEAAVLSAAGPIVWARDGYERTGVTPYVHAEGARTTSLRRVGTRSPLFTNGAAASLADVLSGVAWTSQGFFHAGAPPSAERLAPADQAALRAFLELL